MSGFEDTGEVVLEGILQQGFRDLYNNGGDVKSFISFRRGESSRITRSGLRSRVVPRNRLES